MMQRRLLPKLATPFMPPEVIQSWKPPLAPQMMPLANHVLMLRLMTRHMPLEITAFGIQPLLADVTIHFVPVMT